jgi:hypothetical protein
MINRILHAEIHIAWHISPRAELYGTARASFKYTHVRHVYLPFGAFTFILYNILIIKFHSKILHNCILISNSLIMLIDYCFKMKFDHKILM